MANTVLRVGLPAALAGAVLGGGAWMLASQGGAEAAPRNAAARPAAATKYDRVTDSGNVFYKVPAGYVAVKQRVASSWCGRPTSPMATSTAICC
ncbi:MAG: hypothetical protein IPO97_05050 [Sphingomonadales bacterium]|nr:hypothetical protein [Sphingomonadales bacterium]